MKFCDVTIAYNERSGGIRTYIDQKRRFLVERTGHDHLLIIPGAEDCVETDGRSTTVQISSPLFPGQADYRFFVWPPAIRKVLLEHAPDIVELGSHYMTPWPVLSYRKQRLQEGHSCIVGAFFHTDVAEAYVGAPLRALAHERIDELSDLLGHMVEKLADTAARGAEHYIGTVFRQCDRRMAPTPAQAARLRDYGVDDVQVVPLGVDLDLFRPDRRDPALRAALGADPRSLVLLFIGRLGTEKHVPTLIEAYARLPRSLHAQLWIAGEGPLRDVIEDLAGRHPGVRLMPYEPDRGRVAAMIASADLYVTAGPHETFGLAVIEAQAAGLPVVGVNAGALVERVPDGLGYLGPVDDPDAMAANILRAAAEKESLGRRARAHVESNFGWDHTFARLLDVYATADPGPRSADPPGAVLLSPKS
ncbi:glycosyltransferase (plasmid) [Skermanella mucosa]|uniref:glycosyltransferase n=1 Tax=Skermanella mucosa TaxID=1789672 RepID=UPI00192CB0D9|nr:glycosyltransferase [Skermanella mucosa]UEM24555.1 glycosyltransferase [Skermanella mucosa]